MTNSSGTIVARYDYDPYGRVTPIGTITVPSDLQYAGYYEHVTSGLNLTMFRAYDPNASRWLSRDPQGEAVGVNLYAYAYNNPIRFICLSRWLP
jgi:RHS repeat-associated protein